MRLRPVAKSDAAILLDLHQASFGDAAWTDFKATLEQSSACGWIAEMEGQPSGFVLCNVIPGAETEILTFCVAPALRRQNLGNLLVQKALDFSRENKCGKIFLEVAADNRGARALYEKFDFKLSGTRPNYYRQGRDSSVDALMYELIL